MSDFGKFIKDRRIKLGLTQLEVANAVGVAEATVSRWESGNIPNMKRNRMGLLAKVLRIPPSSLIEWDDESELPNVTHFPAQNLRPMPTLLGKPRLGRIACGDPIFAEEHIECYDKVPDYVKCDFTLLCKGDSMINARIFDGDIVCIRVQPQVESGEIAAVLVDDEEATLKRVRLFPDHIVLEPENPMYKPMAFWGEEMNRVRIVGKATHFISVVR